MYDIILLTKGCMEFDKLACFIADGIAWDWMNEKLYWADASTDRIEVYDPSTRYRKVLINTGSNTNPADIIVDPNNGYVSVNNYRFMLA